MSEETASMTKCRECRFFRPAGKHVLVARVEGHCGIRLPIPLQGVAWGARTVVEHPEAGCDFGQSIAAPHRPSHVHFPEHETDRCKVCARAIFRTHKNNLPPCFSVGTLFS